jgi:hypothetical protein
MNDVIEHFYDTSDDFPALCECFEKIRDTEDVMQGVLLSLYHECLHVPEGIGYVDACAKQCTANTNLDFMKTGFGKVLGEYISLCFGGFLVNYDKVLEDMLIFLPLGSLFNSPITDFVNGTLYTGFLILFIIGAAFLGGYFAIRYFKNKKEKVD